MTRILFVCAAALLLVSCSGSKPVPVPPSQQQAATEASAKPEIASVQVALGIDPTNKKLRGVGSAFPQKLLNEQRKIHVAILLKNLGGGETLYVSLVDPTGKESEPIVRQFGKDDTGEFIESAFFEARDWTPGPHQIKANLNNLSFAMYPFVVTQ